MEAVSFIVIFSARRQAARRLASRAPGAAIG
jgi:hypothetical protein